MLAWFRKAFLRLFAPDLLEVVAVEGQPAEIRGLLATTAAPTVAPTFKLDKPLKIGAANPNVVQLKTILKGLGYNVGTMTPAFDRIMDEAVREFQRNNGLVPDGLVGPKTAAAAVRPGAIASNVQAGQVTPGVPPRPHAHADATPTGLKKIPFAVQTLSKMKTRGAYPGGYPWGAVVHYTAGPFERGVADAEAVIEQGIKNGYTYLAIAGDGTILQAHDVDQWGYHAGESNWPRIGKSVSNKLIGIEICNPGILTRNADKTLKTWYGDPVRLNDTRLIASETAWGCPAGYYLPYTDAQEAALERLLRWLEANDPTGRFTFDYVLGHHEVSGKAGIGRWRKSDPGGALSMPMSEFRAKLKAAPLGLS